MDDEKGTGDRILVEEAKGRQTCDTLLDSLVFWDQAKLL